VLVFGGCLWLFRFVSWSWMPHHEPDRWVVATAFASVAALAVLAAGTWWSSREPSPPAGPAAAEKGRRIHQRAWLFGRRSQINQVGGDQHITRT
jgi:hypothetical protein